MSKIVYYDVIDEIGLFIFCGIPPGHLSQMILYGHSIEDMLSHCHPSAREFLPNTVDFITHCLGSSFHGISMDDEQALNDARILSKVCNVYDLIPPEGMGIMLPIFKNNKKMFE